MSSGEDSWLDREDALLSELEGGFLVGGGRYTLRRQIGAGAATVVWLANDVQLGEDFALKFYRSEVVNDSVLVGELRRQAQRSRHLNHPNIVRVQDILLSPGELSFIAMEYVEGRDLGEFRKELADQIFEWEHFKPLAEELFGALEYAHGEGVAHGNLKPSNLIHDARGRLRLADFGLAPIPPELMRAIAGVDVDPGMLPYLSPERLEGGAPSAADDIYAAGAILYAMLSGTPPFWQGDVPHQIRNAPPQALAERLGELGVENAIPAHVSALLMACLAKKPEERPATARAVLDWLAAEPETAEEPAAEQAAPVESYEPISLIPPDEEPGEAAGGTAAVETEFTDPWKGESSEEERERFSVRDWVAAHSVSVAVVAGLCLVMGGYYIGVKQYENRAMEEAQQNTAWVAEQIALDEARRERLQNGKVILVGTGPVFHYSYEPRTGMGLDTNALNTNVRFWYEGAARNNCAFLTPGGGTNQARGTITYQFEAEPGFVIEEMTLWQSSALYTRGSIEGAYSVDGGTNFTTFYATPPFQRGAHGGHAERASIDRLHAASVVVRYTLFRFEGEEYNVQFLRDCDDAPGSLEISGRVVPASSGDSLSRVE